MKSNTGEVIAKFNSTLNALEDHYKTLTDVEKGEIERVLNNLPKAVVKRIKQMKTKLDDSDDKFLSELQAEPIKRKKKEQPAEQTV